jgi:hypothetical protein
MATVWISLMSTWLLLASIPVAIVVGLLTSIATIAGIMLTNSATARRLERQFAQDRVRDEDKRLFESRKEIYMDAAEAIAIGMGCIGRMGDLAQTTAQITKPYLDRIGALAKVQLISSETTAKLVLRNSGSITILIADLTATRLSLDISRRQIDKLETSGGAETEINELRKKLLPLNLDYIERCILEASGLWQQFLDLIFSVRIDLGSPSFSDEYRKFFVSENERIVSRFSHSIESMRRTTGFRPPPPSPYSVG